jgi:hypothetical protein
MSARVQRLVTTMLALASLSAFAPTLAVLLDSGRRWSPIG